MKKQLCKLLDLKSLKTLLNNENSCIHLEDIKDHLALHPYHLNNLNFSVSDLLNQKIGKYAPNLNGILCGFENINFLSETGKILEDSCFIHIDISADFFIFRPEVGKLLTGIVNKTSKDHVGCLVHHLFNVSVPKPKHGEWLGEGLGVGSEVQVEITGTNFEGKLPYIKGRIESVTKANKAESKQKKKKKAKNNDEEEIETAVKKNKKRKREEEDEGAEVVKKKKKKLS